MIGNVFQFARSAFRTSPKFAATAASLDMALGTFAGIASFMVLRMVDFEVTSVVALIFGFSMLTIGVVLAAYAYSVKRNFGFEDDSLSNYDEGYNAGYDEGYEKGHAEGHDEGYDAGYADRDQEPVL